MSGHHGPDTTYDPGDRHPTRALAMRILLLRALYGNSRVILDRQPQQSLDRLQLRCMCVKTQIRLDVDSVVDSGLPSSFLLHHGGLDLYSPTISSAWVCALRAMKVAIVEMEAPPLDCAIRRGLRALLHPTPSVADQMTSTCSCVNIR